MGEVAVAAALGRRTGDFLGSLTVTFLVGDLLRLVVVDRDLRRLGLVGSEFPDNFCAGTDIRPLFVRMGEVDRPRDVASATGIFCTVMLLSLNTIRKPMRPTYNAIRRGM